jgi:hypothetical protein
MKSKILTGIVLGLTLALAAVTPQASAQQSNNNGLHAVPPPHSAGSGQAKKVVIDGKLDDWDLSGQIDVYANFKTRNNYSTKVAAMYDQENFYLSIIWRDSTPMFNMIDSNFDIGSGWRGDCLQLRLKTDMVIADVDCWYSTAAQHPVVNIAYGRFTEGRDKETDVNVFQSIKDALKVGAQQAFLMGGDGKSYTQEIALPWKLITGQSAIVKATGKPYKAPKTYGPGDSFNMGMEFLWGGPDGRTVPVHRYVDNLMPGTSSREFFWGAENAWGPVFLEKTGNLKLERAAVTESQDGYLQKTDGPVALAYDLPEDGFVTLVIEDADGRRVRNLVGVAPRAKGKQTDYWDGLDEQGNLAAPGTYRWRGLFHAGIDPVYEASYGVAGIPPWDTADGTGAWLSDHAPSTAVACGKEMVVLAAEGSESGYALIGTDYNGRKKWGMRKFQGIRCVAVDETYLYAGMNPWNSKVPLIGRLEIKTAKYAPFETKPEPQLMLPPTQAGETARVTGIAVVGDRLAVALAGLGIVRFFDKKTAQPLGDVAVAKPAGLAADAAGVLYAVSGAKIVKIAGNVVTPVVETGLVQPTDVAVAADGAIFVADPGANQVSNHGKSIVADPTANQVKVFDAKGAFVRAIGAKGGRPVVGPWNAKGMLNPTSVDVDAQGRVWVIEETMYPKRVSVWTAQGEFVRDYIGPGTYGGMGGVADPADKTRVFGNGCEFKLDYEKNQAEVVATVISDNLIGNLVKRDGREYFMAKRGQLYQRRGDAMVKVAFIGACRPNLGEDLDRSGLREMGLDGMAKEKAGRDGWVSWIWCDLNDDGKAQPEEANFVSGLSLYLGYWGGYWLDEQFNIYIAAGVVNRVPLKGWTAGGAPIWDMAQLRAVTKVGEYPSKIYLASGGQVIVGSPPMSAIRDDGTVRWTYKDNWPDVHGSHRAPIPASDDLLVGTLSCIGTADTAGPLGKLFACNSNMGRLYVFTMDGLLAATVFQDCRVTPDAWPNEARRGTPFGHLSMGGEWFGGYFFKAEKSNEYYLIVGPSYNLLKLNGMDKLQPLAGGKVAFTGEHLVAADKLMQRRAAQAAAKNDLTITTLKAPVAVDGKPDEFPKESWVEWAGGPYKLRGALAVDAANLYAAWEVKGDANPMVNGGQDFTQLFVTGDSVDLQLGTNPGADPKRGETALGDLRLLVSVMEGKPVAVLYRWKTAAAEKKPVVFTAPWHKHEVDSVTLLTDATVSIQRAGDGYKVELSVPLSTLGFKPEAGMAYKADLGAVFSDATGNNRAARVYWSNKATGLVNDVPGEIAGNPNLWGTARLAP